MAESYVNDYFDQLLRWLDMEADAERVRLAERRSARQSRDPERSGETLIGLMLSDHKNGLAGRILLDLCKPGDRPLPMTRLKVGSPVIVTDDSNPSDEGISAVISARTGSSIQIALDRWPDAQRYRLDLSPDETTRRRQIAAMATARNLSGRRARLRDVLLGEQEPRFDKERDVEFLTGELNPPQQAAVRFMLSARDLAILHGPPGTGKTTTVVEVIVQAVRSGKRVLACAPSNTAVDNLLERLVRHIPSVLRVGHPARVFESLRGHTLDELVESDSATAVVKELWDEVDELMRAAQKPSRSPGANRRRGELFAEAGRLRQQAKGLQRSTVRHIIDSADVICTTTTLDMELLGRTEFDLVVIDEACQCVEPAIWQAALQAETVLLAGDHLQLPPTVVSKEAAREGYDRSSMQRLIETLGESIYRRLVVQYRMNEKIMNFSSEQFYDGGLIADASVKHHILAELPSIVDASTLGNVSEYWDSAGASWDEELETNGLSKLNRKEAAWVVIQVRQLLEAGVLPEDIAVIAPYAAQVRLLRNRLQDRRLEVDTVDGFQGREKEAVIITLTRSNSEHEIGFLSDTRRTNVALTRARRWLRVVGDSATLATHPFYSDMLEYFESIEGYHSVWELGDEMP